MTKEAERTKDLMLSEFKELHSMSWDAARGVFEVYLESKLQSDLSQPFLQYEHDLLHSIRKERLGL